MKTNTHPTNPGIIPIKSISKGRPFAQVTCDFITDLPISNGFDSIMVVVDHGSTKRVIFSPCTKEIDALGTAQIFIDHTYKWFGLPDSFLSDWGSQFSSKVFKELGRQLGINLKMSTAYHPQTDGETERVNQELETYLRIFCGNNPDTWAQWLALIEFCHNQQVHSVTKKSPFFLMMGYEPHDIPLGFERTHVPAAEDKMKELTRARDEALAAHELARQTIAKRSNRNFIPFQKRDQVWLEAKNLKLGYESRKFAPKREGPFDVIEVLGPVTYRLRLPQHWRIHPVFHASLLTPYHENPAHGSNYLRPPPDLISGEEQYEVEAIVNHKRSNSGMKYLVKWKRYPSSDNTWQTVNDLKDAPQILTAYRNRHRLWNIYSDMSSFRNHLFCRQQLFQIFRDEQMFRQLLDASADDQTGQILINSICYFIEFRDRLFNETANVTRIIDSIANLLLDQPFYQSFPPTEPNSSLPIPPWTLQRRQSIIQKKKKDSFRKNFSISSKKKTPKQLLQRPLSLIASLCYCHKKLLQKYLMRKFPSEQRSPSQIHLLKNRILQSFVKKNFNILHWRNQRNSVVDILKRRNPSLTWLETLLNLKKCSFNIAISVKVKVIRIQITEWTSITTLTWSMSTMTLSFTTMQLNGILPMQWKNDWSRKLQI